MNKLDLKTEQPVIVARGVKVLNVGNTVEYSIEAFEFKTLPDYNRFVEKQKILKEFINNYNS